MQLREEFVLRALSPGANISALCREYDIHRKTGYKAIARYKERGVVGLADLSRRPHRSPLRVSAEMTIEVLKLREAHPKRGPKYLRAVLLRSFAHEQVPSERTIARILERAGKVAPRKRRCKKGSAPLWLEQQTEVLGPNDLWTVDFKGWWRTLDEQRYEPLTVRDQFSRKVLCAQHLGTTKGVAVRGVFERLFEDFGLPKAILVDNGAPFASTQSLGGLTELSAWWVSLGIRVIRTRPAKPQDNGGHERMHRDIAQDVQAKPALDAHTQQPQLDLWRYDFNHVRPHQALGMKVPAEVYRRSERPYMPLALLDYPQAKFVRTVHPNGVIRLHGTNVFLSKALRGQRVGLSPVDERYFECFFAEHRLGVVSLEHKKLLPEIELAC